MQSKLFKENSLDRNRRAAFSQSSPAHGAAIADHVALLAIVFGERGTVEDSRRGTWNTGMACRCLGHTPDRIAEYADPRACQKHHFY